MAGAGEGPVQEAVETGEERWWDREPYEGDQGYNWNNNWRYDDRDDNWRYDDWDDDGGFPLLGVLATLAVGIFIGVVLGSMGR